MNIYSSQNQQLDISAQIKFFILYSNFNKGHPELEI